MFIVTGGSGLIGSSLVWGLNRAGIDDILVVDHLGNTTDKWKNLAPLRFSDYLERDAFREMLRAGKFSGCAVEGVLHMGACSATTERDASYLIDNNFKYTCELAEFCIGAGIRFLYASSCATYGDGSRGYVDDESKIEELRPMNMYGYSKQLFDLWAKRRGYLKSITGCKFSNVYGPNERHKGNMRSVVCRAFEQITATGKLQLFKSYRPEYADGEQMRDFLYVKDAVRMVLNLFNRPSAAGLYNIGSGRAETWNASPAPRSPRSAGRWQSNTLRCRSRSGTATSITPGRRWANTTRSGLPMRRRAWRRRSPITCGICGTAVIWGMNA